MLVVSIIHSSKKMKVTNHQSKSKKANKKKRRMKKPANKDGPLKFSKQNKANNRCLVLPCSSLLSSTPVSNVEDYLLNEYLASDLMYDEENVSTALDNRFQSSVDISSGCSEPKIEDQTAAETVHSDSDSSSEEKGKTTRKDRKPLPLMFDQSCLGNSSNSDSSEDTKETNKCVYLGDRETLASFADKCHYECFTSKRCVAGEKPKRKYRKKPKTQRQPSKKRKQLDAPLSCIDTRGTAVTARTSDYLSRYEMLVYMDPLADRVTPMQKKDFEMAFRMVKPSDVFALNSDSNNKSTDTDYTNSDTD